MVDTIVSISEQAFFSIITTALESYKLDHVLRDGDMGARVETFGHLWGYLQDLKGGDQVYRIVWADTSTAVVRDKVSVAYDEAAQNLKQEFVDTFFPEVSYLGDYHSHPYSSEEDGVKTELELERAELYKFSDADFRSVRALQSESALEYRVGLVVTVFEREQQVSRTQKRLDGESCIRFQYSDMTIWLKAYVWSADSEQNYRRKACKMVRLVCPSLSV